MRGKYSRKPAPRTLSPEMDKWEREQQAKHTREKQINRAVRKLIREVREASSPNKADMASGNQS